MEAPKGKMNMSQIQAVNKISYSLPSNLSVVERRTNKVNYADQNTYVSTSGSEVVIRLQASTDYVYGPNCYLAMDINVDAAANGNPIGFVNNTAMSLFSRVLYEDRSGAELERNSSVGRYVAQVQPLHWSKEYISNGVANAGQLFSGNQAYAAAVPADNDYLFNGTTANYDLKASPLTVIIPLRWFLGVFNNETLIPSMLVSGSLIRLQLARIGDALQNLSGAGSDATSYQISNARVVLDSLSLSPVVQKNLMEQSQSGGGLDYTYETVYHQSASPNTNSSFNLQINKAVSRCQKLYWSSRAETTPADFDHDNLGTCKINVSQLDYRLGDMFFPQKVISVNGDPTKNGGELYENTLQSIHRMKTNIDPPSVSKNEFLNSGEVISAVAADNDNNGKVVHCQSFEMSSALEFSGLAVNNSRTLEARINFTGTQDAPQVIDAWICYLKLAKCNQLRAIIKE
jgi:hypothetical protein